MEGRDDTEALEELIHNGDGLSIALGGPIYTPNWIGRLTMVPRFESSLLQELQCLEAELHLDSSQPCDEDISVDGLKVFTEEQLLNMALEESMQSDENANNQLELQAENLNAAVLRADKEEATTHNLEVALASDANRSTNKMTARKRKRENISITEGNSIGKVTEIVEIKQKQDSDRAAVKLHAFKWKKEIASSSSESKEMLTSLRSTNFSAKVPQGKSLTGENHEALRHPTTVLFVEVYHKSRRTLKTQEFLALGRQTLAELKDKIYCSTDKLMEMAGQEYALAELNGKICCPTDKLMEKAGQQYSSGYFLIEDVFYNDLRDPSAIDYSKPILDWLRNSEDEAHKKWECILTGDSHQKNSVVGEVPVSHVPHFRSVSMNKVRFCDLKFRLGARYLYCHQGDCKHTIVFRDMRLIHPEDVHDRAAYPIVTFQLRTRAHKCDVCNIYRAEFITIDDKWAQENPCYLCRVCHFLLHYSEDGNVRNEDDFKEYKYLPE